MGGEGGHIVVGDVRTFAGGIFPLILSRRQLNPPDHDFLGSEFELRSPSGALRFIMKLSHFSLVNYFYSILSSLTLDTKFVTEKEGELWQVETCVLFLPWTMANVWTT